MISEDEDRTRGSPLLPGSRSAGTRYGFAVVAALAGTLVTAAVFQTTVSDQPIYAPMIGAVALTAWYGGFGPSLVAIALAWSAALWLFVDTHPWLSAGGSENVTRWWINLVVVLVIAGFGGLLRMRGERAAVDASSARDAVREIEALQQLSAALAGALSSSDVARVVTRNAAQIVSARGVALGLVDGGELALVDPTGLAAQGRSHGDRLALEDSSLLCRAVRDAEVVTAAGRAELEGDFHDTATALPDRVEGAIAVPLWSRDRVVGSLGFVFDRAEAVAEETVALAVIMGDLTAQALERARLYERERESRAALDRILQVAPRFLADDADDVIQAICREARTTFGADFGVLWRIRDDDLVLLAIDPPQSQHAGTHLSLQDFPQLRGAMVGLEASFVPDVLETTSRDGLRFVRELGIRSSLRTPVVIAGVPELVLAISWRVVLSEPDTATVAVVRRFADQAGLALEQLERRRAQAAAAERVESTRRLQDVTAALSRATTIADVSNTCLEHALESVGAEAGFIVLNDPEGTTVEIVSSSGYDDEEIATWRAFGPDDDVPFARAISSGEPVWAFSPDEMSAFSGVQEPRSSGWATIPLQGRDGARGALHLSLRSRRTLGESEREWLQAMVSQCSQAMERSALYEEEQRSRRRAERVQSTTASLSNALTMADVARVVVAEVASALEADEVGIVAVTDDGRSNDVLAWEGDGQDALTALLDADAGADAETPAGWAIRARRSVSFESPEVVAEGFPAVADEFARAGAKSFLLVPLVAARRTNALLLASWRHSQRLSRDDRSLVEVLAAQAASGARPRTALRVRADHRRDAPAQRLAGLAAARGRGAAGGPVSARDGTSRRRRRLVRRGHAPGRQVRSRRRRRGRKGGTGGGEHVAAPKRHTRLLRRAAQARVRARPPESARRDRARHLVRDRRVSRARSGDRSLPRGVRGPSTAARRLPGRPRRVPRARPRLAAGNRDRLEVPPADDRAARRSDRRPVHGRPRRTPRAIDRRRASPNCATLSRRRRRTRTVSSSTSSSAWSAAASGETTSRSSPPACCPWRRASSIFASR